MSETKVAAERVLFAVDESGREFGIRALVGVPYEADTGDWACPVMLEGLHGRLHDVHGVDSWQALVLAMNMVGDLLIGFIETGGKIYREKGGGEISVGELFENIDDTPDTERELTEEQQARIDELTAGDIEKIDEELLANASTQWRKVARVVGSVIMANLSVVHPIPETFYAERVRELVAAGKLESQGNLEFMRYSEVRLRG